MCVFQLVRYYGTLLPVMFVAVLLLALGGQLTAFAAGNAGWLLLQRGSLWIYAWHVTGFCYRRDRWFIHGTLLAVVKLKAQSVCVCVWHVCPLLWLQTRNVCVCLTHLPIVVVTGRECLCVSDTFTYCCGYRQGMSVCVWHIYLLWLQAGNVCVCLTHLPIVAVTGRECLCVSDTFAHCCGMSVDVQFIDDICLLGKAHMRSDPSVRSFPNIAFEMVPMFVWMTIALSRPFKEHRLVPPLFEDCLALPLSTPVSSRRSMVWCPWLCAHR